MPSISIPLARRLVLAALAGAALLAPAAASADTRSVAVRNDFFAPKTVTIDAGDRVAWTWRSDGNPHNVAGATIGDSGLRSGGTFRFTFRRAGRYRYVCDYHPGMSGTVVVQR